MRTDYNKEMKRIIGGLSGRPRLMLHVCCAPCTAGVYPRLKDAFDIEEYFYNPNIDTAAEYELRKAQFAKLSLSPFCEPYEPAEFLREAAGLEDEPEGGARCRKCIALRMDRAAAFAKALGAEWFCSTLSVSPHKDAAFINECGTAAADKYNIKYLINDFKKEDGFKRSVTGSIAAGLYRQNYCGCAYSRAGRDTIEGE